MTMKAKRDFQQEIAKWREDVRQIAGQVRGRMQSAGAEVKQTWAKLEPKVQEFEQKAGKVKAGVASELSKAGAQLKQQLEKLRQRTGFDKLRQRDSKSAAKGDSTPPDPGQP